MADYTKQQIFDIITEYLETNGSVVGSGKVRELKETELTDDVLSALTIPSVMSSTQGSTTTEEWVQTSLKNMMNPITNAVSNLSQKEEAAATAATSANSAAERANEAAADVEEAIYNANTAATNADTSREAIEANEATRQSNESIRQNNESARKESESTRQINESTRGTNETARKDAEVTRQTNESVRQTNEAARSTAEQTRQTNESTRQSNETKRQSDTATAIQEADTAAANANTAAGKADTAAENADSISESAQQAENVRISNENARKASEDTRISNESSRVSAENERKSSETQREENEDVRRQNETERIANEQTRLANEQTRQAQETSRQTNTAAAIQNASTAADSAQTNADYAKTQGDYAKNLNEHPAYVAADGYWYYWDYGAQEYVKGNYGKGDDLDYSTMTASERQDLADRIAEEVAAEGGYAIIPLDGKELSPTQVIEKNSILSVDGVVYIANKQTQSLPFEMLVQDGKYVTQIYNGKICYVKESDTKSDDWDVWICKSEEVRFHGIEEEISDLPTIRSDIEDNRQGIADIDSLIPAAASTANELSDKKYVDDSVLSAKEELAPSIELAKSALQLTTKVTVGGKEYTVSQLLDAVASLMEKKVVINA